MPQNNKAFAFIWWERNYFMWKQVNKLGLCFIDRQSVSSFHSSKTGLYMVVTKANKQQPENPSLNVTAWFFKEFILFINYSNEVESLLQIGFIPAVPLSVSNRKPLAHFFFVVSPCKNHPTHHQLSLNCTLISCFILSCGTYHSSLICYGASSIVYCFLCLQSKVRCPGV